MVGANLVEQANTAPLLTQVQQHPAAFAGNALEGFLQLVATVAAHGKQRIARQALGVHPPQHRRAIAHIAQGERNMVFPRGIVFEAMHGERGPGVGSREAAMKRMVTDYLTDEPGQLSTSVLASGRIV